MATATRRVAAYAVAGAGATALVAAAILSFLVMPAAHGQVAKLPPQVKGWRMETVNKNGKISCAIAAAIIDGENRTQYILAYTNESNSFVITSAGGNFKQAGIKVDSAAPIPFKCAQSTCFPGSDELEKQLIEQMRRGKTAFVALQTTAGPTAGPFTVPLEKFATEWDRFLACNKK